jgi:predicted Zn-dependent peptidase
METEFWKQLASSHGRAETLGAFEIATGDFRSLLARGAEYPRVTATDVQKAAATYLATGARSVVIARPGSAEAAPGQAAPAHEGAAP